MCGAWKMATLKNEQGNVAFNRGVVEATSASTVSVRHNSGLSDLAHAFNKAAILTMTRQS